MATDSMIQHAAQDVQAEPRMATIDQTGARFDLGNFMGSFQCSSFTKANARCWNGHQYEITLHPQGGLVVVHDQVELPAVLSVQLTAGYLRIECADKVIITGLVDLEVRL